MEEALNFLNHPHSLKTFIIIKKCFKIYFLKCYLLMMKRKFMSTHDNEEKRIRAKCKADKLWQHFLYRHFNQRE